MSYCPECLAEYKEGSAVCIDCQVPLRPGPPPNREEPRTESHLKLVRLRTFSGPTASMNADLVRNLLQEEGIPSILPGETAAEVIPGADMVQLLVREEDAPRAEEILAAFENADAALPEEDPAEPSANR